MAVDLKPHQQTAVDKLSNGKILCGGVGVGKTVTALAYFYTKVCGGVVNDFGSVRKPRDLYVITTARKRDSHDWQTWAMRFGLGEARDASVGAIQVTVDSWNNITKYKDVKDAFFVFDEQRLVGSGAWASTFIKISKHNQWILLSATPGDTWLDYIPVFIANGWYKNRTEFKRHHCVYNNFGPFPKLERYIDVGPLVRHRNAILVEMPYERHTTRHLKEVTVDYDIDLFEKVVKKRWHVYEDRPIRNVSELFSVMRKVVNTDASRLQAVSSLLETHPRVIVFYNFDYELEMLRTLIASTTNGSTSTTTDKLSEDIVTTAGSKENDQCLMNSDGTEHPPSSKRQSVGLSEMRLSKSSEPSTKEHSNKRLSQNPSLSSGITTATETPKTLSLDSPDSLQNVQIAEWNGHKHEPIPDTERWIYLVQYVAGAEAWNCIETNAVILYSLTYSYKNFEQVQGRIDRMDTPFTDLYYYILTSKSPIDRAVAGSLKQKKSFNERDFATRI